MTSATSTAASSIVGMPLAQAVAWLDSERPGWRGCMQARRERILAEEADASAARVSAAGELASARCDSAALSLERDLEAGRVAAAWLHGSVRRASECARHAAALWGSTGRTFERTSWQQLRSDLRERPESEVTGRLRRCGLLVLDGVGETPVDAWMVSALLPALRERDERGLPTVTVSPMTPSDFAEAARQAAPAGARGLVQALKHGDACRMVAFGSGWGAR